MKQLKFALYVGILLFLAYQYFRIYMLGGYWVPHRNPEVYSISTGGSDGR